MTTEHLWLAAPMALPALPIGLAWFLHEREHRVLSRRPFRETTGKHRRERVRTERTSR